MVTRASSALLVCGTNSKLNIITHFTYKGIVNVHTSLLGDIVFQLQSAYQVVNESYSCMLHCPAVLSMTTQALIPDLIPNLGTTISASNLSHSSDHSSSLTVKYILRCMTCFYTAYSSMVLPVLASLIPSRRFDLTASKERNIHVLFIYFMILLFTSMLPIGVNCAFSISAKILAADGLASDQFGSAVTLYGTTAMIGAWADDDKATDAGIYKLDFSLYSI